MYLVPKIYNTSDNWSRWNSVQLDVHCIMFLIRNKWYSCLSRQFFFFFENCELRSFNQWDPSCANCRNVSTWIQWGDRTQLRFAPRAGFSILECVELPKSILRWNPLTRAAAWCCCNDEPWGRSWLSWGRRSSEASGQRKSRQGPRSCMWKPTIASTLKTKF